MVITEKLNAESLIPMVLANVERESRIMTDEFGAYRPLKGLFFAGHGTTSHGRGEYVNRIEPTIHSNSIEGCFSIFKRGMRGVYQFCSEKHLNRYLAEFDCRYSNRAATGVNDIERTDNLLRGVVGKRLTYKSASVYA